MLCCALAITSSAEAQTPPDAGRLLQEQAPRLQPPKKSPGVKIDLPPAPITLPGGAAVKLQTITFTGNTVLSAEELQEVIADAVGRSLDLAGLRKLAEQISSHYRANGYPFALAYLPPQSMEDSRLIIAIVEGRYGAITALGNPELIGLANEFLSALKPSAVIESSAMERATMILDDLQNPRSFAFPGLRVRMPGAELRQSQCIAHFVLYRVREAHVVPFCRGYPMQWFFAGQAGGHRGHANIYQDRYV